jgi:hypothetical protein
MRQPLVVRKWDQQGSGRAHHKGGLKHDKRVLLVIYAQYMPCFVLDFVLAGCAYHIDELSGRSRAKIPPYAILSHTWKEGQEVTFSDLKDLDNAVDVNTQRKEGYRKIRFCAQQAKRDGLDYFWVDTCCIDKANNTELSRVISSMFRWYRNAKRCYVFLSDVENGTLEPLQPCWKTHSLESAPLLGTPCFLPHQSQTPSPGPTTRKEDGNGQLFPEMRWKLPALPRFKAALQDQMSSTNKSSLLPTKPNQTSSSRSSLSSLIMAITQLVGNRPLVSS